MTADSVSDYAEIMTHVLEALVRDDHQAAIAAINGPLPTHTPMRYPRQPVDSSRDGEPQSGTANLATQARVFARDGYRCRYCAWRLAPPNVAWAVRDILGDRHFPAHRNRTEPPYWHRLSWVFSAELEHVYPKSRGGAVTDPRNLVAACFACARAKGTSGAKGQLLPREAGLRVLPRPTSDGWDGLVRYLPHLADLPIVVEDPYGSHRAWREAVSRAAADPLDPVTQDARPNGLTQDEAEAHRV